MLQILPKSEFSKIYNASIEKYQKLSLIADMCRLNTFVSVKKAGSGHLGSSFSAMDIAVYLYYERMNTVELGIDSPDRDIYFSSKGHDVPGLYSIFYSLGILPLEKLLKLRRMNGVDGHPEINIPGIEASTGSLGMGISKGKGMAWAKTYNKNGGHVYVLIGDGELQEGQIYESLQTTAHQKIANITVIVDRNKFQTDKSTEQIIALGDLENKFKSFGWYVDSFNGHSYEQIEQAFMNSDKEKSRPKILIANTVKGKGVSFMEPKENMALYKWHSGAPDDISFKIGFEELFMKINNSFQALNLPKVILKKVVENVKIKSNISKEYVAAAFGEELVKIAHERNDIIVLDGDLSADCKIREFEAQFPDRFIENGIAEQDMVSMAGGLAAQGLLPIVNSFASFLAARPNEQIYNNATEGNKIIYACHFAGMIPAGPGKSHQSVRDISLFSALPNITIIQPCNSNETKLALRYFVEEADGPCVLRMNIGPSPQIIKQPENYRFHKGMGSIIKDGDDACIVSYGPVMLNEALIASEILQGNGIGLRVVNMPWLNITSDGFFNNCLLEDKMNYILEDHMKFGGLFDHLNASKNLGGHKQKITCLGLDVFPQCGNPVEVLNDHQLNGASIAKVIGDYLGEQIQEPIPDNYSDYSEAPQ
jgi:transketolase